MIETAMNNTTVAEYLLEYLRTFNTYYIPFVIGVGLIGNLLSVLVFLSTKLRKIPSSHYLTALAIADSGMLLSQVLPMLLGHLIGEQGWCQTIIYLYYVFSFVSVWYVVCFTIERYIAVCYPLKRLFWCTISHARKIIIAVSIVPCIFNINLIVILRVELVNNRSRCGYPEHLLFVGNIFNCIDSILTLIVPMLLIIGLNVRIVRRIIRHHKPRSASESRKSTADETRATSSRASTGSMLAVLVFQSRNCNKRGAQAKDDKVTRMLLVVSVVFILMNLPDHLMRTLELILKVTKKWDKMDRSSKLKIHIIHTITNVLFLSNFSVNFFLYNIVGLNFRRYLKRMLVDMFMRATGKTYFEIQSRHRMTQFESTEMPTMKRSDPTETSIARELSSKKTICDSPSSDES